MIIQISMSNLVGKEFISMEQESERKSYLSLLETSLEKKCELLSQLYEFSKEQEKLMNEDKMSDDNFNRIVDEKDKLIFEIHQLDEGFDKIYQRVKNELSINQNKYIAEIIKLKELIKNVTDKGVQLQVIETRNKSKMDTYFKSKRNQIKSFKLSNKSATNYYKNMVDQNQQQAYFFDKKK
jgi:hypothetical protein